MTQFTKGDKVTVYGHVNVYIPDGTVGTYDYYDGHTHWVFVPGSEGSRGFCRAEPADTRSELQTYKEDVLFPALERKNKQHNWCGEYDEFLKEIGVERPLIKLPTGSNALVQVNKSGVLAVLRRSNLNSDQWVDGWGNIWSSIDVQKYYTRTIFEGE